MQVDLVLDHPFAAAQLAQHVGTDAGPAKRQLVVGVQQRVDLEFVRDRCDQHQLVVLAPLVRDRRVRRSIVLDSLLIQRRDVADRIAEFIDRLAS